MKRGRVFLILLGAIVFCSLQLVGLVQKPKAARSPVYTVLVNLRFSSPFVPDGRMSLASLAFSVTFDPVVFEFNPEDNFLMDSQYCYVDTEEGQGVVSECSPNDVEPESPRHKAKLMTKIPLNFTAELNVKSEELGEGELPLVPLSPPEKINLKFRTTFGRNKIKWIAPEGSCLLEEQELVFPVPWTKLIKGENVSVTIPYRGSFEEDKGTWWIEFIPHKKAK